MQISKNVLVSSFVAVALINVLYFFTYPINIGAYDYPNYLRMIADGSSNLVHASGYSAILHVLLKLLSIEPNGDILRDVRWLFLIQAIQLCLHLALLALYIWLCAKLFGSLAATIAAIGSGCSILLMSNVNAAAPEWLQAHAIILSLLLSAYAGIQTNAKAKGTTYSIAAAIFGVAYLIKYNSLVLAPAMAAFILLDVASWRFKVRQIFFSVLFFGLIVSSYALSYHQRTTGTKQLSFDHAWVLTISLPDRYFLKDPEGLGVNSLRWLALCAVTPPEFQRAYAYQHIDYGAPPDVRKEYQAKFEHIFKLSKQELIDFVKKNPLPTGYNFPNSSTPLYFYYGLQKTDKLGISVYLEALHDEPVDFFKRIVFGLTHFPIQAPSAQVVPTFSNPIGHRFISPNFSTGTVKILPPEGTFPLFSLYYNPTEIGSIWGIKFIDALQRVTSSSHIYLLLNLLSIFGLAFARDNFIRKSGLILMSGLVIYTAASMMLLGMRSKELIAIIPLYFVLLSLGLVNVSRIIIALLVGAKGNGANNRQDVV